MLASFVQDTCEVLSQGKPAEGLLGLFEVGSPDITRAIRVFVDECAVSPMYLQRVER